MDSLLAQTYSFAQKYCHGSFPSTLSSGSPVVQEPLCTVNDLIGLAYQAIHFVVMILTPAAVVFAATYGAILITLYGVNPGYLKQGQDVIRNAVIGLVIVWSAWAIVNTFFWVLGAELPCNANWYTIAVTCPK
jgi:hypothetical protein